MSDTTKLLNACVEYRAMVDRIERENAALRADIHAHEQINKQLIEDKRRLDFLATLTGSGWACLHLNHKGTNDDWLLTRKQIDRRMATEAQP